MIEYSPSQRRILASHQIATGMLSPTELKALKLYTKEWMFWTPDIAMAADDAAEERAYNFAHKMASEVSPDGYKAVQKKDFWAQTFINAGYDSSDMVDKF